MKKYIQPNSEMTTLQTESIIAASLSLNNGGTDATPLSNGASNWESVNWNAADGLHD